MAVPATYRLYLFLLHLAAMISSTALQPANADQACITALSDLATLSSKPDTYQLTDEGRGT